MTSYLLPLLAIVTLCAFIVLMIIVSLLHLAFFWLPLVRICIPRRSP